MTPFNVTYTDGRFTSEFTVQARNIEQALKKAKQQITVPYTRIKVELREGE